MQRHNNLAVTWTGVTQVEGEPVVIELIQAPWSDGRAHRDHGGAKLLPPAEALKPTELITVAAAA